MTDFKSILNADVALINEKLALYMSESSFAGRESEGLSAMLEAMEYSLSNGGKRIRPVLVLEFCRLFSGNAECAISLACAVEMIHTYSLIHDDLPCMDDDDMRRGKASSHIKFGYANALLAGDALLTLAFETALSDSSLDFSVRAKAALELAKAAGASGMIAGQVMDLANEGRQADITDITETDKRKTGELIRVSAVMGCIAAGASEEQLSKACEYCEAIGLAFQIVDDILDVTGDKEELGKPIGSDADKNKSTYVSCLGLEESKRYAAELTEKAKAAVSGFENSQFLVKLADELCGRSN